MAKVAAILGAMILVGCQTTNPHWMVKSGNRSGFDLRPADLIMAVAIYREFESKWPVSRDSLEVLLEEDSVSFALSDFIDIEFSNQNDTLFSVFSLQCDSLNSVNGSIRFFETTGYHELQDSIHYSLKMESICGPGISNSEGVLCIRCDNDYFDSPMMIREDSLEKSTLKTINHLPH